MLPFRSCQSFNRRAAFCLLGALLLATLGLTSGDSPEGNPAARDALKSESLDFSFRLHRLKDSQADSLPNFLKIMRAMPAEHSDWQDPQVITLTRIDRAAYRPWQSSVVIRYDDLQRRLGGYRLAEGQTMPADRPEFERMLVEALEGRVGLDMRDTLVVSYRSGDKIHLVEMPYNLGMSIEESRAARSQGISDVEAARATSLSLSHVLCWIIFELFQERALDQEDGPSGEPSEGGVDDGTDTNS